MSKLDLLREHESMLNHTATQRKGEKMIKVLNKEWDENREGYLLTLEDDDSFFIPESKYDLIQIHISANKRELKAVVDEHEDDMEPIEYLGFELVS